MWMWVGEGVCRVSGPISRKDFCKVGGRRRKQGNRGRTESWLIHTNFFNGDAIFTSERLRNRVHLTNYIHQKNCMHRYRPVQAERSLMRDLLVLQRSRSLRDPSTSPPSWKSPSIATGKYEKNDDEPYRRKSSMGLECIMENPHLSMRSPWLPSSSMPKAPTPEISNVYHNDMMRAMIRETVSREREYNRNSGKNAENDLLNSNKKPQAVLASGKAKTRFKFAPQRSTQVLNIPPKKITDFESGRYSHRNHHSRQTRQKHTMREDRQVIGNYGQCNGLKMVKKCNLRGVKRAQDSIDSRHTRVGNDYSVASTSLAQGSMHNNYCSEGKEHDTKMEGSEATGNGCGILRNWSRIHHSGKTFLDKAGRSLSCGISDSRPKSDEPPITQSQRDTSVVAPDRSCASMQSDSDVLPLLNDDTCGSQQSAKHPLSNHDDYSGEVGIFTNHTEQDSDASSGVRHKGRHKSLTQKYMPQTFKDLVGHNLVVQALTNAVQRKRVGLIYVFYGPQGTGKSSCARIFARALNCLSLQLNRPCGACTSCIAYNLGKSRNIVEMSPVGNFEFESILEVFEKTLLASLSSQYKVFIMDDCDAFPSDSWNSISKIINRACQHVVFLLVSSSPDHLPHLITSRGQKFFFPKLKDADIICKLQCVAFKEGLQIDKDALKLIASRSDGSVRDAEMTLDQLSLLGQRISLNVVQELVGLVSDEKLVDLLDLALSADTVNTIKSLREIMEAGVEPLPLMSQLATTITDILAGSYILTRKRLRRKFFRRSTLSINEIERLRFALRTLSEWEKQLRVSNDKITWLTAALLQLAPDQQYMLPISSTDASFSHSPMVMNFTTESDMLNNAEVVSGVSRSDIPQSNDHLCNSEKGLSGVSRRESHSGINGKNTANVNLRNPLHSAETKQANRHNQNKDFMDADRIWIAVIEKIQINALKHFMHQEARLMSVSFGAAPTVQLMFSSNVNKSKAESFRGHILQAFESVLCTGVTLEIRNGSWKETTDDNIRSTSTDNVVKGVSSSVSANKHVLCEKSENEIIEILASPTRIQQTIGTTHLGEEGYEPYHSCLPNRSVMVTMAERKDSRKQPQRRHLVREKLTLAHVIHKPKGCPHEKGSSRQKAISIAGKLEQENMKMESKSKGMLCCWKASRCTRRKLLHLKTRTKGRRQSLLTVISCGRCCSYVKTPTKVLVASN